MKRKIMKNEKGSLTVEALLFLIPFMCAYLTIINGARFVQTEMLIHHAITQTCKQISTYSYVLTKTDITKHMQNTNGKSEQFKTDVGSAVEAIQQLGSQIGNVGSSGDIVGDLEDIYNSGQQAGESLSGFLEDPSSIAAGVFAAVKSEIRGEAMSWIAGELSRSSIKSSIGLLSDDPNEYLENLGVVDGLDGLDFSKSTWISNSEGKGDIRVVVTYQMKNLLFPDFDIGEREFSQCASTLVW